MESPLQQQQGDQSLDMHANQGTFPRQPTQQQQQTLQALLKKQTGSSSSPPLAATNATLSQQGSQASWGFFSDNDSTLTCGPSMSLAFDTPQASSDASAFAFSTQLSEQLAQLSQQASSTIAPATSAPAAQTTDDDDGMMLAHTLTPNSASLLPPNLTSENTIAQQPPLESTLNADAQPHQPQVQQQMPPRGPRRQNELAYYAALKECTFLTYIMLRPADIDAELASRVRIGTPSGKTVDVFLGQLSHTYTTRQVQYLVNQLCGGGEYVTKIKEGPNNNCCFVSVLESVVDKLLVQHKRILCDVDRVWISSNDKDAHFLLETVKTSMAVRPRGLGLPKSVLVVEKAKGPTLHSGKQAPPPYVPLMNPLGLAQGQPMQPMMMAPQPMMNPATGQMYQMQPAAGPQGQYMQPMMMAPMMMVPTNGFTPQQPGQFGFQPQMMPPQQPQQEQQQEPEAQRQTSTGFTVTGGTGSGSQSPQSVAQQPPTGIRMADDTMLPPADVSKNSREPSSDMGVPDHHSADLGSLGEGITRSPTLAVENSAAPSGEQTPVNSTMCGQCNIPYSRTIVKSADTKCLFCQSTIVQRSLALCCTQCDDHICRKCMGTVL